MEPQSSNFLHEELSAYHSLKTYCKVMYFLLDNLHEYPALFQPSILELGLSMFHTIFTNLLFHSRNVEFSQEQTQQYILVFLEYMSQSNSYMLNLNPIDAYRFILKKSICMIPLKERQLNVDKPHQMWTFINDILTIWNTWASHIVCEEKDYNTIRQYFNSITDLCQNMMIYSYDTKDTHQYFLSHFAYHDLLILSTKSITKKLKDAIEMYQHTEVCLSSLLP